MCVVGANKVPFNKVLLTYESSHKVFIITVLVAMRMKHTKLKLEVINLIFEGLHMTTLIEIDGEDE